MAWQLLYPVIALTVAAFAVMTVDLFWPQAKSFLSVLSGAGILAAGAFLWQNWGKGGVFYAGGLTLYTNDGLTQFFQALFLATGFLLLFAIAHLLKRWGRDEGEFYSLYLLSLTGTLLLVATSDLLMLYVALELMNLAAYALAGFLRDDAPSGEAALKYFVLSAASSAVILYGVSLLYGVSGSTSLPVILETLGRELPSQAPLGNLGMVMLLAGFAFKASLFPFHMWAPDAYQGAPTPVAAFLSVVSKSAAFAVLIRFFALGLSFHVPGYLAVVEILAVGSMTLGNLVSLGQTSVKRLLAYSSVAQAGYVMIGLAVGNHTGLAASLFYLITYAFMNTGAFAVVLYLAGSGHGDTLEDFAGLSKRHPWAAFAMLIFMASLAGLPPFAGLLGKFYLFEAAAAHGLGWLAAVGLVNSVISFFYYFRVVRAMYMEGGTSTAAEAQSSWMLSLTVTLSAVATVILGVWAEPFLALARGSLGIL